MPDLEFEGKSAVYAHHLGVEARDLRSCAKRSEMTRAGGGVALDGSLIVHGDNLHALKALLPRYEGKVNCVYIDPPYNTGNEGWCYNDKVNSPLMKKWLKENGAVDGEDAMRHDKWLCMMWPRLKLLQQLLADDGVIFVSIDDNEQAHLRAIMNEIFGEENFIASISVKSNPGGRDYGGVAKTHDYVIIYAKNSDVDLGMISIEDGVVSQSDDLGNFELRELRNRNIKFNIGNRPNLHYPFYVNASGVDKNGLLEISLKKKNKWVEVYPLESQGVKTVWRWGKEKSQNNLNLNLCAKSKKNGGYQIVEKFRRKGKRIRSILDDTTYRNEEGTLCLKAIFGGKTIFEHPKSPHLIKQLIQLGGEGDIVLDSFAGSGTTAHAVLELNKEDGGNRKFILVECEDYADTTTAERVRRVINGVPNAKKDSLHEGTGGSFTYCTLGETMTVENMLQRETKLPEYETLASHVFWVATGKSLNTIPKATERGEDGLFGETDACLYYLVYEADRKFLLSNDSALNIKRAQRIAKTLAAKKKKEAVVFATQVFLDHKDLAKHRITFSQLPYCIE